MAPPPQSSAVLSRADTHKLAVILHDLAPPLVLDQPLTTPDAPAATLRGALSPDAPLVSVAVLRGCINDACTAALLASALHLGANEHDSARLLNQVDHLQHTLSALLDQLEHPGASAPTPDYPESDGAAAAEDGPRPSKLRRYMLHRTLANGVDLFTSAALLSDADLQALAAVNDTDVVAVHPPAPPPAGVPAPPVPSLGDASPAPPAPPFPPHAPPAVRAGRAPGLHVPRLEPTSATNPSRQPTALLAYPSPFLTSLAPAYDSTGATESYPRTAARALSARRTERWMARLEGRAGKRTRDDYEDATAAGAGATTGKPLTEAEREALVQVGIDPVVVDELLASRPVVNGNDADEDEDEEEKDEGSVTSADPVTKRLVRNAKLIAQVGRAQVVRRRRAADAVSVQPVTERDPGSGNVRDGFTKADPREQTQAATLLSSLTSLLSAHSASRPAHHPPPPPPPAATTSASSRPPPPDLSTTPSLLPRPEIVRILAARFLATRTPPAAEAAYTGTLDERNSRALTEAQLAGATGGAGEAQAAMQGGGTAVPDLKVEG